jgi:hypothetical protein
MITSSQPAADRAVNRSATFIGDAIRTGVLGAAIVGLLCVGGVAAETALAEKDIAGRWNAQNRALTLDISPCGGHWCGVQVTDGTQCGATVLQLDFKPDEYGIHFTGRLELAAATQPYAVRANLLRTPDGALTVHMLGNTGPELELIRRTFPFSALMVRLGDPVCTSGAKTS